MRAAAIKPVTQMRPLSNFAARDVETLLHPTTNLLAHRSLGSAGAGARRGRVRLRHRRQALHRGPGGAVVHGAGLRQRRAGRGRARADVAPLLLAPVRRPQPRAGDRAGREAQGHVARHPPPRCSSPTRARRPTTRRSRSPGTTTTRWGGRRRRRSSRAKRAYHGTTIAAASLSGLSVFHADFDLPMARILHTDCPHYGKYAEPGETEEEYASRLVAQSRDHDRAGRAGDDRRLHCRAGDGRGRRAASAQDLFREGAGGAGQARHRLHRRRGDLRLCANRQLVGLGDIRHPADHRDHGQGYHLGLRADGRGHRLGAGLPGVAGRERQAGRVRARLHLFGPPAGLRRRAQDHRDLRAHRNRASTCSAWRRSSRCD